MGGWRWGLSPAGWVLACVAAGLELGSIAGLGRPLATLGIVRVPVTVIPAALLLAAFGSRLFSRARYWLPFALWAAIVAAVPAWWYRDLFGGIAGVAGFVIAAAHEEVVFRVAFPVIVCSLLGHAGAGPFWSRTGAVVLPAALFAILPNHLRQADSAVEVLPFFTFGLFFGLLVRRPDAILPAALAHLTVNLLTIPVALGYVGASAQTLVVAVLLAGFAAVALLTSGDEAAAEANDGAGAGAGGGAGRHSRRAPGVQPLP